MRKSAEFAPELRERAVRMLQVRRGEYQSLWPTVESIAAKVGCVPQTLHTRVKQQEIDAGQRDGVTTAEAERIKDLERENRELRKANEIVKLASAFLLKLRIRLFSPRRSSTAD